MPGFRLSLPGFHPRPPAQPVASRAQATAQPPGQPTPSSHGQQPKPHFCFVGADRVQGAVLVRPFVVVVVKLSKLLPFVRGEGGGGGGGGRRGRRKGRRQFFFQRSIYTHRGTRRSTALPHGKTNSTRIEAHGGAQLCFKTKSTCIEARGGTQSCFKTKSTRIEARGGAQFCFKTKSTRTEARGGAQFYFTTTSTYTHRGTRRGTVLFQNKIYMHRGTRRTQLCFQTNSTRTEARGGAQFCSTFQVLMANVAIQ